MVAEHPAERRHFGFGHGFGRLRLQPVPGGAPRHVEAAPAYQAAPEQVPLRPRGRAGTHTHTHTHTLTLTLTHFQFHSPSHSQTHTRVYTFAFIFILASPVSVLQHWTPLHA